MMDLSVFPPIVWLISNVYLGLATKCTQFIKSKIDVSGTWYEYQEI